MKRICMVLLPTFLGIALALTGAMAQQQSLAPAADFPDGIVAENYVPSLYYPAESRGIDHLVAAPDFPYSTCDLCYSPSLYFEAWRIASVGVRKQ